MRSTVFFLGALVLAVLPFGLACAGVSGDIVQPNSGIVLGRGWYARESYQGSSFRWVSNDAEFLIRRPPRTIEKLALVVEAGPGLGVVEFPLQVRDASGHVLATADVNGKARVRFDLPVKPGRDAVFALHVEGGGKKIPSDPRTLNFRVFAIADASADRDLGAGHPDITAGAPNVTLGNNWYPLEQFKGETFRWINNDATFTVTSAQAQEQRLRLVVAPGPGLAHPANFFVHLRSPSGREMQKANLHGRDFVYFDLPLKSGANTFELHVDDGGRHATNGDTRILNFRVFSLTVV